MNTARVRNLIAVAVAVAASEPCLAAGASGPHALGDPHDWINSDDYPSEALRSNATGTVVYRLNLDAHGGVSACVITISSGKPMLDKAACDIITMRARFSPAINKRGQPIPSTYTSRVVWQIPNEAIIFPLKAGGELIEFDVTKEGKIENCKDNGSDTAQRTFCDRYDRVAGEEAGLAVGTRHVVIKSSIAIETAQSNAPDEAR